MGGLSLSNSPMAEAVGARATLECRWVGWEGTERQLIAFKSSGNVYAFVYALLIQVLELRTPKCDNSRTNGAPSGGRTHTGRILSPLPLPLGYRGQAES